jgi:hypothetical protein
MLIRVALKCQEYTRACLSVSWHFWRKGILLEAIKECMKKYARDGSSLADLCPTAGVASCSRLIEIIPSKNKGHTLFLKSWHDGSPSLLPCHTGQIGVVDAWAQSPLKVSGLLCGLDGKKVEAPNTSHTIPGVDFEWLLQFSLWYK